MKKTLQRVLAVVLSLVMVAGLVAIDSSAALAAKKLKKVSTGKKTVYSGQSRTFKISGTNAKKAKWTVSGTGKKYVKITGKKTGTTFKFKVKANATGKAKITAKLTKKNKVSYTYTLKCKATSMSLSNQDIYTGETVTLTPAFAPSNAVKPAGDAVYEVFSDADCAVKATTAVATASGISAEFAATAPGTYYVKATVEGLEPAVAAITVTDKVAKLTSVQQTKKNELVVTVDAADPKLTPETLYIQDVNEQRFYVKSITPDKADATKLTVVTLTNMANGKEITVSYAGSSQTFTATTGEVSSIELNYAEVPIKTNVTIKALTKDVNGVQIDEEKYGTSNEKFSTFDIVFRNSKGTADPSEGTVNFDEVGEVADVTIKYNTGKYDANNEAQYIEFAGAIVGKEQAVVTEIDSVRYYTRHTENYTETDNNTYEKLMKNRAKYMSEKVRAESKYRLAVLIKDAEGFTRVNGSLTEAGYILSSADDTTLIVEDDLVVGVKGGKTQILASNDKGEVQFTIPVTVEDAPRLKTVKLSSSNITLTTGNKALPSVRLEGAAKTNFVPDSGSIDVEAYDQYGERYTAIAIDVKGSNDKNYEDIVKVVENNVTDKITATVEKMGGDEAIAADRAVSTSAVEGDTTTHIIKKNQQKENQYTITVTDENDDANKVTKSMNVRVKQPGDEKKLVLDLSATERDTTVKEGSNVDPANYASKSNQTVEIKLAVTDSNGVHIGYVPLPSLASITINRGTTKCITDTASQVAVRGTAIGTGSDAYEGASAKLGNIPTIGGNTTVTKAGMTIYGGNMASNGAITKDSALGKKVAPFRVNTTSGGSLVLSDNRLNDNIVFVTRGLADKCADGKIKGWGAVKSADWKIASKVDTGSYRATVKGVKFKAEVGVEYTGKDTDTVAASFTVKDSQGTVAVTQDYNTTSETITNNNDVASSIALHTLRFTPTDAEPYVWNAADSTDSVDKTYRVGFREVSEANKGYKTTDEKKITFTRLVVLVPYRDDKDRDDDYSKTWGSGIYVPMVVNANYSVTAE